MARLAEEQAGNTTDKGTAGGTFNKARSSLAEVVRMNAENAAKNKENKDAAKEKDKATKGGQSQAKKDRNLDGA